MVKVFFRNDDVFEADKRLLLLNKIFTKNNIPLHNSVIPKKLSESSAKSLIEMKIQNSELIEYGQHGYLHKNFGNERIKFEFLGRSYEQQKMDIEMGKNIMERLLGEHFILVFAPPYNKYDKNTLLALDKLNFRIFSATKNANLDMREYNFSFVPVSISFNIPFKGFITDLSILMRQFRMLKDREPFIGIYLHHHMLDDKGFKNLLLYIKYLRKEDAEFCRLSKVGDKS